ncbi:hypothetical protein [Roseibium sp.]|uniref:hypothetical protein n=1 Tax=Roseibium sp. TaxID=1936156 RepID=UPI003BB0FAA2
MRYFFRNFHVYVFAVLSVLAGSWVASNPDRTVELMRPLVEDAVELQQLADGAYREVSQLNWQEASDEAVSLFVATMRMPTMLFERLAEKLDEVNRDLDRRRHAEAAGGGSLGVARKAALTSGHYEALRENRPLNERPEI